MTRRLPQFPVRTRWLVCAVFATAPFAVSAAPSPNHSRAELHAQLAGMSGLVQSCGQAASACDAARVPDDEVISAEGTQPGFTMRWDWLRQAIGVAGSASAEDRQQAMKASDARLAEVLQETGGGPPPGGEAEFRKARSTANEVLSRVEFDKVAPPSWWDRFVAKIWDMLDRLFEGVGKLGQQAPWLGKVLEWLFFLAAAVGLLFFARRNFQRQRLAASLRGEQAALTAWDREATDWATLAERAAASGDWRDAVHCLYWASIVRLEGRRAWRHNPARTPREYVRLLKPGSVQRESLGGLTGLLERVWYGLRPAAAEDYQRARSWFERLSDSGVSGVAMPASGAPGSERA